MFAQKCAIFILCDINDHCNNLIWLLQSILALQLHTIVYNQNQSFDGYSYMFAQKCAIFILCDINDLHQSSFFDLITTAPSVVIISVE